METEQLRPIERTIRRLRQEGGDRAGSRSTLRPIERCVLNARQSGSGYPEIAARLRRSPNFVSRVEEFANLKLDREAS